MNLVTFVIFTIGLLLMWSAIKDKDPRKVVKEVLGRK